MCYTIIVPGVRGMFPFVNSLGLNRDYICRSYNSSDISRWMKSISSEDKP